MKLVGTPNLGDYIPQIASLDLHRVTKKMKAVAKAFDVFVEKIIDEHVRSTEENRNKDFVDVMLGFMGAEATEYRLERDTVKAIILLNEVMDWSQSFVASYRRENVVDISADRQVARMEFGWNPPWPSNYKVNAAIDTAVKAVGVYYDS
ncbi:hypothetical protein LWI29_030153 [Acer saccharum]|uniref:Uncharacterized protein n=1 Tax=Acer saccharum TaxID=4024 RepID=A0AA39RRE9_ACESA|nr:hypothetical protein LWI29_030153 [Acer saccharum]